MKKSVVVASVIAFTGIFLFANTVSADSNVQMHRMYNKATGEHFYTANTNERDNLKKYGWQYEGIGWYAPKSGDAVYRLYNKNNGDHHYTTSAVERDSLTRVGWNYEGVGWYSSPKKEVPLYRAYNPNAKSGSHNYTVSRGEQDFLVKTQGWRDEGIGWYGVNKDGSNGNNNGNGGNSGNEGNTENGGNQGSGGNTGGGIVTPPVQVDKSELIRTWENAMNQGYAKVQFVDNAVGSNTIWTEYENAYQNANAVRWSDTVTQAEVNNATTRLQNAVNSLEAVPKLSESQYLDTVNNHLFNLINDYRVQNGKQRVSKDSTLQQGSNIRIQEALVKYDHIRPDGSWDVYAIPGYPSNSNIYGTTSENLGQAGGTKYRMTEVGAKNTAKAQLEQWINSSGHLAAMLKDTTLQNGRMSIASAFKTDTMIYVQMFIVEAYR